MVNNIVRSKYIFGYSDLLSTVHLQMRRDSVQPKDQIFVKGYGFLSFAKNMVKSIGKNESKKLSGKYSQKFVNRAKQSATDTLKATQKE